MPHTLRRKETQTIAVIGCGAIGEAVARYLADCENVEIGVAITKPDADSRARDVFGNDVEIANNFDDVSTRVDLAVECAGHPALSFRFRIRTSIPFLTSPCTHRTVAPITSWSMRRS